MEYKEFISESAFRLRKPKNMPLYHKQAAEEHQSAYLHLHKAAGFVTNEQHREKLLNLAEKYKAAAQVHREACDAHEACGSKGLIGSGQRQKTANEMTKKAKAASEELQKHTL